ncbi:MAG TPA: hypothetical protein DIT89_14860 [Planctomycetaceae bacterium]|nr:hypothetical protein [Planctomycetaceae bacterium]
MSRLLNLAAGLFLVSSLSGCCLMGGYPYGAGCAPCGTNACGQAGGYPSAGLYNPSVPQTALLLPTAAGPQTVAIDALKTH